MKNYINSNDNITIHRIINYDWDLLISFIVPLSLLKNKLASGKKFLLLQGLSSRSIIYTSYDDQAVSCSEIYSLCEAILMTCNHYHHQRLPAQPTLLELCAWGVMHNMVRHHVHISHEISLPHHHSLSHFSKLWVHPSKY